MSTHGLCDGPGFGGTIAAMRRTLAPVVCCVLACTTPAPAPNDAAPADATPSDLGPADASTDAPAAQDAPQDVWTLPPYVDPYACAPAGSPRALDDSLDATESRAGVVTRAAELIGGEAAAGRLGHLRIYNNRVRIIVQARAAMNTPLRAAGYDLYGGNLLDMDVTRPATEPGGDVFREMFPIFGYRVSDATEVAVACDGSGGHPAAIRVVGHDTATRLLGFLDSLARDRDVRIVTHYILRPNSSVLEVRTEVQSNTGLSVPSSVTGEFLGYGSALTIFSDATGFGDAARATSPVHYLAAVSDPGENHRRVSYAIAPASGTMSVPIVDASGTAALYAQLSAPVGASSEFVRYVSVGTGDASSVIEPLMVARHDPHGVVTGTSSPDALVYAYTGTYAAGATVRSMARAQHDGTYRLALPPGTYALVAVDEGRNVGAPVAVTVTDGGEGHANPTVGDGATLTLDLHVVEVGGARTTAPVKVSLLGTAAQTPDPQLGDIQGERESYGLYRAIYSLNGAETLAVKPGRYHAVVSRGEEYDTFEADVTLTAGGAATLTGDLHRVLDTAGWISGDFHQHTVGSIDSGRALCNRVLEDVAEGLEYAATTDHDNVSDFGPCTQQLGLGAWFNSMRGNEISVVGVGHFNAYPLTVDAADPTALVGAQYWADQTAQQLFDRVRHEAGNPLLHISHPRSGNLKGYFTYLALDPHALTGRMPVATGWEALEVNADLGNPVDYLRSHDAALATQAARDPTSVPTMQDWFGFLRRGQHPCALGNSDTHMRNGGSGWPHNLLRVGPGTPDTFARDTITAAIRAQHVVVASGLVLDVRVRGDERMGWQDVVRPDADGTVPLEITLQAPAWVRPSDLVVYENGRPLALARVTGADAYTAVEATADGDPYVQTVDAASPGRAGVVRWHATVRVHPSSDAFYVVVARGASLSPVGSGSALGYTNPVYVDLAGDGWNAPAPGP